MGKYLKKILIAGGLGYLGGRMAKYLSDNGYRVLITTRRLKKNFPKDIPINTSVIQMDYKSDEQLNEAVKGIDTLIHLAGPDAHTNFEDPDILIKRHVDLTKRLYKSAQKNHVKHFIYFSTIHVYGNNLVGTVTEETKTLPIYPFAKAHLEAEKIVDGPQKEIVTTIFRCSNTFGAPYFENEKCWKLVVNNLCKSAFHNGKLVINSSGQDYRDFIAAEDVVQAIHYLLEIKNERRVNHIFNLGSSDTVRIIDIARKIQKELIDGFDYDCPIIKNKPSKEMDKPKHFILSTEKIKQLGFTSKLGDDNIFSLLNHCKMKYQLVMD
jgi:UDP-glucose 4-epimerase